MFIIKREKVIKKRNSSIQHKKPTEYGSSQVNSEGNIEWCILKRNYVPQKKQKLL